MVSFAKRFKYLREKHSWTQDEIAEMIGVSRATIAGYESEGKGRIPREETLNKIADLFNTTIDYLLGRTDDPSPRTSFTVAGKDIELSDDEAKVFLEMRKHPSFSVMFHDLASNPEKKIKMLIKMWEVIKADMEDESDPGDGFGELKD